ncbi:MAG: hypothetical protein AAB601_00385, partial [Patescibacteria group bacterium]
DLMRDRTTGKNSAFEAFENAVQTYARRRGLHSIKSNKKAKFRLLKGKRLRGFMKLLRNPDITDTELTRRYPEFKGSLGAIASARFNLAGETVGARRNRNSEYKELTKEEIEKLNDLVAKRFPYKEIVKQIPRLKSWKLVGKAVSAFVGDRDRILEIQTRFKDREESERTRRLRTLMQIIRRKRRIRKSDVYFCFPKEDKDTVRGWIKKWVDIGTLIEVKDPVAKCSWYFANEADFYTPAELYKKFVPETEKQRLLDFMHGMPGWTSIQKVHRQLYDGKSGEENTAFLETLLEFFVERKLVEVTGKGGTPMCRISGRGRELGLDAASIRTLELSELENRIAVKREKRKIKLASLEDVQKALEQDRKEKLVKTIDFRKETRNGFRVALLSEVLFGQQNTDMALLNWALRRIKPTFTVATGLVQGNFTGVQMDKYRTLANTSGLDQIDTQFQAAGLLLSELYRRSKDGLFIVQGDDDWYTAWSYAAIAMLAEGKNPWAWGVDMSSLSKELERRMNMAELRGKRKIQWEIMTRYQYLIGSTDRRSLLNSEEVYGKIGYWKSEYRLIMEILLSWRYHKPYPKEYEDVVHVDALRAAINDTRLGKVYATPDSLVLTLAGIKGREDIASSPNEFQLTHNTQFSAITQYVDPTFTLEKVMRHFGARGEQTPRFMFDAHQEFLYLTHFHGHWLGCLPGMQNTVVEGKYRIKTFNSFVLGSKSHRQNTFRKSPTTPMVPEIEQLPDGRIRFYFHTNAVKRVVEEQRDKPHEREIVCLLTDLQHGSITMQPESELKFMDYALYGREEGLANRCYENGDVLQGFIYPAMPAENRPIRLVTVDAQQRFTNNIQMPMLTQAPKLVDWAAWMGNHEWGIWSNALTGQNALIPMEQYLQGYLKCADDFGIKLPLQRAMTVNRIRLENAGLRDLQPRGAGTINHPYFSVKLAGFKVAITHMWLPFGGGRTPVDQQRKWLSSMADAASDIDVMFGGDKHSFFMAAEYDKLLVQLAASATQSGYELARGLFSTVYFTIAVFDSRDGIMLEMVPWQFLFDHYKCVSPFLKGKDKDLERPTKDGVPYEQLQFVQGKLSPFIEHQIDEVTRYIGV